MFLKLRSSYLQGALICTTNSICFIFLGLVTLFSFLQYGLLDVTILQSLRRVSEERSKIYSFKYSAYLLCVFEMFYRKGSEVVPKTSINCKYRTKFQNRIKIFEKYLSRNPLSKVAGLKPATLLKNEFLHRYFSIDFTYFSEIPTLGSLISVQPRLFFVQKVF